MPESSYFTELRKRKVVQSAAIYGAVAWGVTEVIVTVAEQLFLPQWVSTLAVIGFVVGFPVAMFLAWTFDLTREGLQRTTVTSRRGKASIVLSLLLVISGTVGLFYLIKPAIQTRQESQASVPGTILSNSIAVLPFDSTALESKSTYLGEALSDSLRDQLGRMSDLRISARSSSMAVSRDGLDAMTASKRLGVANLVEGSIRKQGKSLYVSVQLIEGHSGLAIWSESFQRGLNELLNLQQSIAEQVVHHVLPGSHPAIAPPATRDTTANEYMLLARYYEQQVRDRQVVDRDKLLEAVRLYRLATEADPKSALTHSRLAGALLYLGDVEAAEAPVNQALLLNPKLSEVQNTVGELYWVRGLPEARSAFKRAVELNPNNADALNNYANFLWLSYDLEGLTIEDLGGFFKRALELDPLSLSRHAALGEFYANNGMVADTREVIEGVKELFDDAASRRLLGRLLETIGEVDQAIAWTIRARDLEPENPDHVGKLAELYAIIGDIETASSLQPNPSVGLLFVMRRYQELIDIGEFTMIDEPDDIGIRFLLGFAYNAIGEYELAIRILSTTGLPDSVLHGIVRSVLEVEGFFTLMNALYGHGQIDLAQELAQWNEAGPWWGDAGWVDSTRACDLAILGRHEEALDRLQTVATTPRLDRPTLPDNVCFQQYTDHPRFREILLELDARRAALREKLPATLAEYGVEL